MGILHATYGKSDYECQWMHDLITAESLGMGAFAAPLVATQFAPMKHWSFHYLTSTGLAISAVIGTSIVFRFKRQEGE